VGWNRFGPWRVDNLLRKLHVTSGNLAFLLKVHADDSDYVLPVMITHSQIEYTPTYYKTLFRLGQGISGGEFRVFPDIIKGSTAVATSVQKGRIFPHVGGSILQISIDLSKLSVEGGWFTTDLLLSERGSLDKIPYRFYFYHPSQKK
jgi:hypothetical protein